MITQHLPIIQYQYIVTIKYKPDLGLTDEVVTVNSLQAVHDKLYCFVGSAKNDVMSFTVIPRGMSKP